MKILLMSGKMFLFIMMYEQEMILILFFPAISKSKEVLETPIAKQVSQRMLHRQERAR